MRLADLAIREGVPLRSVREQAADAVDLVVHMNRTGGQALRGRGGLGARWTARATTGWSSSTGRVSHGSRRWRRTARRRCAQEAPDDGLAGGLTDCVGRAGLGFAAADRSHSAVVGLQRRGIPILGMPVGSRGRIRAALGAYRPHRSGAERLDLPPAVQATLAVLRRPAPFIVLPAVGGWLLGILARDVLFSSYLVLLGLGASLYLAYRQTLRARQGVSDEVRRLVDAFVGLYRVNPTTFTTLGLAAEHVPAGWVRDAALAAVRHYEATRDTHEALKRLLAVPDPYLVRFVLVLDQAGEQGRPGSPGCSTICAGGCAGGRTTRLAAQEYSPRCAAAGGAVEAAVATTAVGMTVPLWQGMHTASAGSRALFLVLTSVAFAAAAFFDRRMRLDEETLL